MLLASTHLNLIVGIDIHIVMVPTPAGPVPTPLPHPYAGYVFDIGDLLPFIGATVFINYKIRGLSFTGGMLSMLKHLPTPPGVAFSPKPIGHDSFNFFGSLKVKADGNLMAVSPFMAMTCNCVGLPLTLQVPPGKSYKPIPTTYLPTSMSVPIPSGKPVIVGGPYVPDLIGMLMTLAMSFGFSAAFKAFGRVANGLLKKIDLDCTKGLSAKLCKMFGEPVDLATGRVVYTITDFEIPGPLPVKWERSWYSDSNHDGIMGHGTHLCYDLTLVTNYNESVIGLILPDGRGTAFPLLLNEGDSFYNRAEKLTLRNKGGYFELEDHTNKLFYRFDQVKKNKYKPAKLTSLNGFSIRFNYDISGKLTGLIDSAGRNIMLRYDKHARITEVRALYKGEERSLVHYGYNEVNDLTEITDALGKTTRIRYINHLMVEKTDRNGQTFFWEYEQQYTGAKCNHTWGDGGLLEGWIKYGKEYNAVTNSLGETTKYYYNEDLLCTKVIDPLGNSVEYVYTNDMELYREIDEEGNITGYTYDKRGNLKSKHLPDNSEVMCIYNDDDQLLVKMNAESQATVYTYYPGNKLLRSVSSPDGNIVSFEYNEENQLSVVRTGIQVTTISYDEDHNLSRMELPGGRVTEWKYDKWSRCIEIRNPANKSQYFYYDELNRIISVKKFDGNSMKMKYDAYEDVVFVQDQDRKVDFTYNALGSLLTREENGTRLRFHYDTQNRVVAFKNEFNENYRFERDDKGQVIAEIGFDGLTRKYERDRAGKVIRTKRPGNKWTEYEYDMAGRLTRAEHSDASWETYSYNRNGQLTEACNENSTVRLLRDKAGRVIKETSGEHSVESIFNELGKRVKITSSLGANINQEFSEQGNLSAVSAITGESKSWNASFEYNVLGLETERLLPGGVINRFEYDGAGRPLKQQVSAQQKETLKRTYSWDVNNRLTRMVNEMTGGSIVYGHDEFSNLAWAKYEDGEMDFGMPDAVGNLYRTEDRTDRKYGKGGRLLESDLAFYQYDDEGNLVLKQEKNGNDWQYEWKGNGMLKQVTRPDGKVVQFEYDALGRRLSKTYNRTITRWVWNGNVPLHEWKYAEKEKPVAIINEFGEFDLNKSEPTENLTSWIFNERSFKPAAKITEKNNFSIITDYLGTPVEMYDERGEKVWKSEYDIRGRIRRLEVGNLTDCPFRYQGQYEDEETNLYYNRYRYYAAEEGLYLSQDPIRLSGGRKLYGYVRDVNTLIDPLGLRECNADEILNRAMKTDADGNFIPSPPAGAPNASQMGARTPESVAGNANAVADIHPVGPDKMVGPSHTGKEGLSSSLDPMDLRKGQSNGTVKVGDLPEGLGAVNDHGRHVSIYPARDMTMEEYQGLLNQVPWQ